MQEAENAATRWPLWAAAGVWIADRGGPNGLIREHFLMPDFLPRREADLHTWAKHFSETIHSAPSEYGVSPERAAECRVLQQAFAIAYTAVATPGSRSMSDVTAKESAKAAMLACIRPMANIIRATLRSSPSRLIE